MKILFRIYKMTEVKISKPIRYDASFLHKFFLVRSTGLYPKLDGVKVVQAKPLSNLQQVY